MSNHLFEFLAARKWGVLPRKPGVPLKTLSVRPIIDKIKGKHNLGGQRKSGHA